jgi:hypothetical protein
VWVPVHMHKPSGNKPNSLNLVTHQQTLLQLLKLLLIIMLSKTMFANEIFPI